MTTDPDPKYKNGIPVRTIGGDDSTHLEDFLEETEGRRGVFTVKTDGFCLRQGSDIMCHLDKRGAIHPRRYVSTMTVGSDTNAGDFQIIDIIICEDGPRITLSFPQIIVSVPTLGFFVRSLDKLLPTRISPDITRNNITSLAYGVFNDYVAGTKQIILVSVKVDSGGTITWGTDSATGGFPVGQATIYAFSMIYDTGKY